MTLDTRAPFSDSGRQVFLYNSPLSFRMADVQDVPPSDAGDGQSLHESVPDTDLKHEDSEMSVSSHAHPHDNDTSSVHSGNESHATEQNGRDAVEEHAEDKPSELAHETAAEPAGTDNASEVPKEHSEESPAAKPQKPAAPADKTVKKAPASSVKSSPVKAGRPTTGPASLVKKVCFACSRIISP